MGSLVTTRYNWQRSARAAKAYSRYDLPQLPMTTDSQGYLVARSDFHEPVGPSFWERG